MARLLARLGSSSAVLVLAACGSAATDGAAEQAPQPIRARAAAATSVPSPTAASGPTKSSTTVAPPARALRKVLLLGDSEMYDAAPFATEAFKAAGVAVNSQAFPGTSLLGKTQISQTFPTVLAEQDPDAVVLLYTGVYFPPYPKTADGQDIRLATPAFWQAWRDAAVRATRALAARGARVYWVLLPYNDITWRERDTRLNDAYLAVRSSVPSVRYVDWRQTIASGPNGRPLEVAPIGPGGAVEAVRGADGRHFSADASRVLADVMAKTVLRDYRVSAAS